MRLTRPTYTHVCCMLYLHQADVRKNDTICELSLIIHSKFSPFIYLHQIVHKKEVFEYYVEHRQTAYITRDVIHTIIYNDLTDAARLVFQRGYYTVDWHFVDVAVRRRNERVLSVMIEYLGLQNYNRRGYQGLLECITQHITRLGFTDCVATVLQTADYRTTVVLLSHSIIHGRLDYVNMILDSGSITVNTHKQHFYKAVKTGKYDIVKEFIRRGCDYSPKNVIRLHAQDDLQMQEILLRGNYYT